MRKVKHCLLIVITMIMTLGLNSCETQDEVEFYLPGIWYTDQEIDFGIMVWGRGTMMTFNDNFGGTIGTDTPGEFYYFRWHWISGGYNTMELEFADMDGNPYAYIVGADAGERTFVGTWYNNYEDFEDRVNGQPFRMYRK